ncbi:Lrp/AsnC ligand binding domain-containing protein [Paenibacillus piscarius]|uniref:Lrp/AsnC ligand binding domain-containing protein n=1 Tax=Paenibacillus piscarius TaxID=1089681 RepID=UPI001EE7F7DA|nr:Lrp/AsnC ligand binding domain-containing protein [Paenibacillus piscarius]
MLLKVRVTSPEVLTLLLDEILRIPDIKETSTTFILSTLPYCPFIYFGEAPMLV